MAGWSITRKNKPRKNAKCLIEYFTDEDRQIEKSKGNTLYYKGIFMPMRRAEVTKITEGSYEIYSRDASVFSSYKELKELKKDYC